MYTDKNKMSFENNVQQWVSLDNQLKLLNEKIKEIREKRNQLSENITHYATSHELTKSTVQISDGKLKFSDIKTAEPLTFRYLEKCLNEIIRNDSQVKKIMDYVKQKREMKVVTEIKRYYHE
jgi:CxxC motif-containing protein